MRRVHGGDVDAGPMTLAPSSAPQYPIRAVAKLTGLSIDTLRAWERRYGAVTPARSDRGRLYSDADVTRLRILRDAVAAGHSVGQIATLGEQELRTLVEAHAHRPSRPAAVPGAAFDATRLADALAALDNIALDQEFSRLAAVMTPDDLVRHVVLPVAREVGDRWNERRGGIAHEHLISSTLQHLLGSFLRLYGRPRVPLRLLFATPSGDRHELGILGAAMLAASHGLAVSYVGPDLPADEIVHAVKAANARVLVLGLTLTDDGARDKDLRAIVRGLPRGVECWAGGLGAERHAGPLAPRIVVLKDFDAYLEQLSRLRATVS